MSGAVATAWRDVVSRYVEDRVREEAALLEQVTALTWARNASVPVTAVHIIVQEEYGMGLWRS